MRSITPAELKKMKDDHEAFQLIDVREPYEVERCSIGGENLPMGEIVEHLSHIRKDVPVVVHCRSGRRASAVINALETRYGFSNLVNLTGGILAYGREVDPGLNCD